jgi:hypothetical protein
VVHWLPASVLLVAGQPAAVRLEVSDRFGNPTPVHDAQLLSLTATSPSFSFLAGGAPVSEMILPADSIGVALEIQDTQVGGPFTFRAADGDGVAPALLAALGSASVEHGPAAHLVVSGLPDSITAGDPASVTVEVADAFGNRATSYAGTVAFTATDVGPATQLPAPYAFQPIDAGRHVFAGEVQLTTTGIQAVSAEDDADPQISGTQAGIQVRAAVADTLLVSAVSDPLPSGAGSDVEVAAHDRFGNPTPDYTGSVHFTSDDPNPGIDLPDDYTFVPQDGGRHRFPNGVVLLTAGVWQVAASDLQVPTTGGAQAGIDVMAGAPASAGFTPAGSAPVTVGATQVVRLTVVDGAGNAVPGEAATIAILDPADGALAPDPGHAGGTFGTPSVQTGTTDANGALTVRWLAPNVANLSDRLGAWTQSLPANAIPELLLTTTASGATRLVLGAPVLSDTAFAAFVLTIVAEDTYGNPDPGATPVVRLTAASPSARFSVDGGTSWSQGPADSLTLSAGGSGNLVRVRDSAAGTLALAAADQAAFLAGASLALALAPAPPAGSIALLVLPDTLTADGRSEAQVLGGPVEDRYGNPVPQYPVTVAVSAGEVHAVDEDPAPGIQRRTDPAGQFTAAIRAANSPALAQISATTAPGGTAAGSASIAFLPRSTFALGIAAPSAAVPGDTLAFRVPITNLGPSAVAFGTGTRFQLQDPDGSQVTTTLTGPVVIGPGGSGELDFQPVVIDTALVPGRYTPLVRLIGTDAHGAPVDTAIAGPFESFAIDVVRIESVLAPPRVSRGQVGVEVRIVARNRGASSLLVTDLGLDFSAPAYTVGNSSPPMPDALGPGAQVTYTVLVAVDPLATLGPVAIDARLEFEAGGRPHLAAGAALPTQWTVEPAADLRYVAASLAPRVVSVGQQHLTAVVVQNLGSAAVVLDPALTRLDFGAAGNQLATPLLAPAVVPGLGSTLLKFADLQVPGNYPVGPAPVVLTLGGLENGAPFAAASTLPDSVTVQAAAALEAIAGSLAPDSVAVGQTRNFSLTLANHGGAGVTLEAGTRLRLTGAPGILELALAAPPVTIPAAGQAALAFTPAVIPANLASGPAVVELATVLIENGLPATHVVPVPDPVTVLEPAVLRFVGQSLAPARVTRGQPAAFALTVANDGQAPVTILGGSRLRVADGVHELAIVYAGPDRMVPGGGGTAALSWPSTVVPSDLAAQSYAPILELATIELGIAALRTAVAPASELTVQAPVDARYVPGTIAPNLATAGQVVAFHVEIENRGGATFVPDPGTRFAFGGFSADLDPARAPTIAGGATDTLFFLPEALASAETGVFSPQVMLAGSDANGAPVAVTLQLAPDQVTVVSGAALRVERLLSTAPRGARVNRGQAISLAVVVTNRGEEAVSGATLNLAGPGLAGPRSAAVGVLAPGDSAAFLVPAVAAAGTGPALVTATLQGGAGAISGLPPLVLPALDDTLTLAIERAAALRPAIALSAPSGAQDGVASGGSLLDLEVLVENQGEAPIDEQGEVTLSVPAGYGILGPAAQALVPATPIRFAVAAPAAGAAPDSIRIAISALPHDLNSGAPAQILAIGAGISIATVTPARLEVALAIVAPPTALAGAALPGQEVTVEALVTNPGQAAVSAPGTLRLRLDPALALAPGETADHPFTVGQPVEFRVLAAIDPGPPHACTVEIADVPPDENTGEAAAVARAEAQVSLATQVAGAQVAGSPLAASARTVARGGTPAAVIGFTVRNPAPAGQNQILVLQSIAPALLKLTVVGGDRSRAELGVEGTVPLESVLGRVELRRDQADGPVAAAWDLAGGGPPRLMLSDTLRTTELRSYVVLVTAAASAPGGSYQLDLGGESVFTLSDAQAGVPVSAAIAGDDLRSSVFTLIESVQVVPNPFTPGKQPAAIAYVLAQDAPVAIEIFTLLGDRVWSRSIPAGDDGGRAGLNEVAWDGRNTAGQAVRNGVYHCRIRGGDLDRMVKIAAIR